MQVQSQYLGICDRKSKAFKHMPWVTQNVIAFRISLCPELLQPLSDPAATKRRGGAGAGGAAVSLEVEALRQKVSPTAPFVSWLFPASTCNSTDSRSCISQSKNVSSGNFATPICSHSTVLEQAEQPRSTQSPQPPAFAC